MKNRLLFPLLSLCLLSGCMPSRPIETQIPKNNKTYEVEYLFEHDGCKVYRFNDMGTWVYFTNCRGETISYPDSTTVIRNSTNMPKRNR